MKKTLQDHFDPTNGPKRILSLDGGGIRGALTLFKDDFIGNQPHLKYLRYNFPITENDLNSLQVPDKYFTEEDVESLIEMSNSGNRELLYEIGKVAVERQIKEEHFN